MSSLVVVTGSGRSGTSSVAGTLKRLGLRIPQPEVAADENNPRGYYEPQWIADFHKQWLNAIPVRTIDTRPDAGAIAMASVTPEREAALREWLAAEVAAAAPDDVVVVKETRAYWVYPLWTRVAADVGVPMSSITMLRHPAQVVRSRDAAYLTAHSREWRMMRETANVAAWMNSVYETERATRTNPRAFVPYLDLLADWRTTSTRLCAQLGLDAVRVPAADVSHPVDDFLTTSLNRSDPSWEGLQVPRWLREAAEATWEHAIALAADPADESAQRGLDDLRAEYAETHRVSAAIASDDTEARISAVRVRLRHRLERKTARLRRLEGELAQLRDSGTDPRLGERLRRRLRRPPR